MNEMTTISSDPQNAGDIPDQANPVSRRRFWWVLGLFAVWIMVLLWIFWDATPKGGIG